jgi:hypothetical protein
MNTAYYDMLIVLQQQTQALIRRNAKVVGPDNDFGVEIKIIKNRPVKRGKSYAEKI